MVRLVARKAFTHRGCSYRKGDPVEVSAVEAVVLVARGSAERGLAKVPAAKPKGRRTYQRADLEAEGSGE